MCSGTEYSYRLYTGWDLGRLRFTFLHTWNKMMSRSTNCFICWGLMSLLNIWGLITTVPVCSSDTLTIVLPRRNAMPQTQDMTPHPVTGYRQGRPVVVLSLDVECHTEIHYYPIFTCLGSDPIGKSFPDLKHKQVNAQLYNAVMVVVSQKLGRKCTISTESWTQDQYLWCANPLPYLLAHSFSTNKAIVSNDEN